MLHSKVSKRYARALSQWAGEKGKQEEVARDLRAISQIFQQSPEFDAFLKNPGIDGDQRQQTLGALLKSKIDPLTFDFIIFLEKKRRLNQLKSICQIFEDLYLKDRGILKAQVTSARRLEDAQLQAISSKLKARFGREVFTDLSVDPSLIGGFKIQIEDMIRDFSIKTQLQRFKNRILNR